MGKLKTVTETKTIEALLTEARDEIESLKTEMEQWRDNLDDNEGLRNTQKYEQVDEAAETLDRAYEEIESAVRQLLEEGLLTGQQFDNSLTVSYVKPYGRMSFPRWARLGYSIAYLHKAKEFLETDPAYKTNEDFRAAVDGLQGDEL